MQREDLMPPAGILEPQLTVARLGPATRLVALGGEIDLYTAPALELELAKALDADARHLIVDLTAAAFIDSTVLGVLLAVRQQLVVAGGSLALVCQDRRILRTLEVAGLDSIFTLEPTLADAMATLAEARA